MKEWDQQHQLVITNILEKKEGAGLIAFGALTALSAGPGIACTLRSKFGNSGGPNHSQTENDYAFRELEENTFRTNKVNSKLNQKFSIVTSQMKDIQKRNYFSLKRRKATTA